MVGDTLHQFQSPLRNLRRRNRINPRAVLGACGIGFRRADSILPGKSCSLWNTPLIHQ